MTSLFETRPGRAAVGCFTVNLSGCCPGKLVLSYACYLTGLRCAAHAWLLRSWVCEADLLFCSGDCTHCLQACMEQRDHLPVQLFVALGPEDGLSPSSGICRLSAPYHQHGRNLKDEIEVSPSCGMCRLAAPYHQCGGPRGRD